MSRTTEEQNSLETLLEQREEIAEKIVSGDYSPERFQELLSVTNRLREFPEVPTMISPRAAVSVSAGGKSADGDPTVYDLRVHGTGVRVIELRSGRKGTVERIIETRPEWIDPLIRWDDGELSQPRWSLILDDGGEV